MATVTLSADLQCFTNGEIEVEVAALNYRELLAELQERYPGLTTDALGKQALAIDGVIIHQPLLETFNNNAELIFVPRIAGG